LKGHSEFEEKEEVYSQLKSVQIHYSDIQNLVKFPNSIGIQRKCSLEAFALDNEFTEIIVGEIKKYAKVLRVRRLT
jgi:hypothetical protein